MTLPGRGTTGRRCDLLCGEARVAVERRVLEQRQRGRRPSSVTPRMGIARSPSIATASGVPSCRMEANRIAAERYVADRRRWLGSVGVPRRLRPPRPCRPEGSRTERKLACAAQRLRPSRVSILVAGGFETIEVPTLVWGHAGSRGRRCGGGVALLVGAGTALAQPAVAVFPSPRTSQRAAADPDHVPGHPGEPDRARHGRRVELGRPQRHDRGRLRRAGRELHPEPAVHRRGDRDRDHRV